MAKISALTELAAGAVAEDDVVAIVDVSASATKKVKVQSLPYLRLLSSTAVDLNAASNTKTTLFTCPVGKSCVVTKVVIRSLSDFADTAALQFGWDADGADVGAWDFGSLSMLASKAAILTPTVNALTGQLNSPAPIGTAGGTFKANLSAAQGAALTCTVDVFGYLY